MSGSASDASQLFGGAEVQPPFAFGTQGAEDRMADVTAQIQAQHNAFALPAGATPLAWSNTQ
jgi:hypothetical protein